MKIRFRENVSRILIIAFILFLFPSDSFTVPQSEKEGLKKIKEAEKLFIKYKYRNAVNKYIEAEKIVNSDKNLSRLYIGLSKSYYALGLEAKSREVIRKIADLTIQSKVDEDKLPRGYLKIFKEIFAKIKKEKEESKIVKTEEKVTELKPELIVKDSEKPKKQVIERPGKKKKKKKSSIFPIVGGALALGAVAFLLTGKKDPGGDTASNTASIHIESTPTGADVYVDGASKGVTTPCDITVSEGSKSIRLVIDGWGETTNTQNYSKGSNYTLNAKLAAYIYVFAFRFPEDSINNETSSWVCDGSGNIYAINDHKLEKFDNTGSIVFSRDLSFIDWMYSPSFYIGGNPERLYFINFSHNLPSSSIYNCYKTDLDGNLLVTSKNIPGSTLDIDTNGNSYLIKKYDYNSVIKYDLNMNKIEEILLNTSHKYVKISISDDNENFFVGNTNDYYIYKYSTSGEYKTKWRGTELFVFDNVRYFCNHGTGDRERIFYSAEVGERDHRLVIINGNGEFLSKSADFAYRAYYHAYPCTDNNGNVYSQGWANNVSRYEPSSETEGSGSWTVASKLKRSNKGSLNGFNNGLRLQKRVDRNAIKKELKDKKEGKKIR